MPSPQPGRTERVIGEQKIVDRVFVAARLAGLVRGGPGTHSPFVGVLAGKPVLGLENEGLFAQNAARIAGTGPEIAERVANTKLTFRFRLQSPQYYRKYFSKNAMVRSQESLADFSS